MKRMFLLAGLFIFCQSLFAQDYLTGKISIAKEGEQQIFYDRTQIVLKKNVLQSVYKVFDSDKSLLYSVYLTNDRIKSSILISIRPAGLPSSSNTVEYDRGKSGLIFTNLSNLDTAVNLSKLYDYLLSFADTIRDYPILHKLKMPDEKVVILDPVSKLRIRKHIEIAKHILLTHPEIKKQNEDKETKEKKQKELFRTQLLRQRDSLYSATGFFNERVAEVRAGIERDIQRLFKVKKVYDDARRYEGEKKKGEADGTGLFMANGNYYSGLFRENRFVSGNVIIQYDAYEYCGEFSLDSLNGVGAVKYKNQSYLLGMFKDGVLDNGVGYSISKTGEVFFGAIRNGQRTGYGELNNTKGEMYYGEFSNSRLIKGYSKDADPFGFFVYSRIDNSIKSPVTTEEGEAFFNPLNSKQ
ncbi:MAG: hypothetical protein V4615_17575 [Bacteroidota bacterium]